MSEPLDEEIRRRATKLCSMHGKSTSDNSGETLELDRLLIRRNAKTLMVIFNHDGHRRLVYLDVCGEPVTDKPISEIEPEASKACLKYLRQSMILDDIAGYK